MADTPYTLNPVQTINPYQDIQTYDPNALQNIESGFGTVQGNLNAINQYKTQTQNETQNNIQALQQKKIDLQNQLAIRNQRIADVQKRLFDIDTEINRLSSRMGGKDMGIANQIQALRNEKQNKQQGLAWFIQDAQRLQNEINNIDSQITNANTTMNTNLQSTESDVNNQNEAQNMIRVNRENYMQALRNTARKQGVYGQSNPYLKGLN